MPSQLRLQFHHNVIEHLGLRLYQNRPDKVIGELVSNSWDADATRVDVRLSHSEDGLLSSIAVFDNGSGMSHAVLQDAYLTVAAPRRGARGEEVRTPGGRALMGRKGLGKLAPFGICRDIDVITGSGSTFNWIGLDLDAIQAHSERREGAIVADYVPASYAEDASLDQIALSDRLPTLRDDFLAFLKNTSSASGSAMLLTKLSNRLGFDQNYVRRALTSRFTVTLARPDFLVSVDGQPIERDAAMPELLLRIPKLGEAEDTIGEHRVKYWVGFAKRPINPSSDAGVGIFTHGKMAQDRPFFFDLTGNHFTQPYIYGVVEADWLDDLPEDIISTDRSSIDWDHPQAAMLRSWGTKALRRWIGEYERFCREKDELENEKAVQDEMDSGRLPRLRPVEQKSLLTLLSDVSPRLPPDHESRGSMVTALASAWLHKPAREC